MFVMLAVLQSGGDGRNRMISRTFIMVLGAGAAACAIKPNIFRIRRSLRERPCCRAAEQRDELATFHSITSSARASSVGGIWRPSAFAVFRLITSSYLVGCMTGRSAGLSPLRIRPT